MSVPGRTSIGREAAIVTGGNILGLAIGLLGTILVTRALGPAEPGLYAWILTLTGIAGQAAMLAPPQAVRAVAARAGPGLAGTIVLACGAGTILSLPLLAYGLFDSGPGRDVRPLILVAWLAVPAGAAALSLFGLVQERGRAAPILAVQAGPRLVQLLLTFLLFWAGRLDLVAAVGLQLLSVVLTLVLVLIALRLPPGSLRPRLGAARALSGQLGAGWIANLALFAMPRLGLLVLGSAAPAAATGQYGLALALQEAALVGPVALGGALIGQAGRDGAGGRRARLRAAAGGIAATVLGAGLAAVLAPLVPLVFGSAFAPAGDLFRWLLIGVVAASVHGACQPSLFHRGNRLRPALPPLLALAAAAVMAVVVIPSLGAAGAVLSNIAGFAVLALASSGLLLRKPA